MRLTNDAERERFQNYVYQRDTMWSLLMLGLESCPAYRNYDLFKLCVLDNVEFCWLHHTVCRPVCYHSSDGMTVQTYVCRECETNKGGQWLEFRSEARQGLADNPYGKYYKRQTRVALGSVPA